MQQALPALGLLTLVSGFGSPSGLTPVEEEGRREPMIVRPTAMACMITAPEDLSGSVVSFNGDTRQIEELQYGIGDSGFLTVAYARITDDNGEAAVLDDRAQMRTVFNDLSQIGGVYIRGFDREPLWAEHVVLGRRPNGKVALLSTDGNGALSALANLFDDPPVCDAPDVDNYCTPIGDDCWIDVNGDCISKCFKTILPGTFKCTCEMSGGVDSWCQAQVVLTCPVDGDCGQLTCHTKIASTTCQCVDVNGN